MSFVNPIFLAALATAALPILYHLVRRIQAKQVKFSSLMFLQMTPREVVRRRRIQHWLLMLMRCLILGLLAFAFTRPFIPKDQLPFVTQRENQSVVLLVDNSFSMHYVDGGTSRMDAAQEAALSKLAEAAGDDEYSVILFSDKTQQLTPLDSELGVHQNAIQSLVVPSYRSTDFYSAIRLAEEVLDEARFDAKRIVLISDIQDSGWQGAFENWKLKEEIDFEIVNLGVAESENSYIDGFSLLERRVEGSVVHRFNARVASTDEDLPLNTVDLLIEGNKVEDQRVGGDALQRASFQYKAPREGAFLGQVTLQDDGLQADNVRYFSFAVENKPQLLGMGGSARDITKAPYYLDRAFNQGDQGLYAFSIARPGEISAASLRRQQVVFMAATNPSAAEINAMQRYVEEGGSLIVSFEDEANVAAYNQLFGALEIGAVSDIIRARSEYGYDAIIGEVDLKHPIFSVFAESGSGAIFRPRFRWFAGVQPDSATTVLGRYDTGEPFLIEREVGKGRVLVYTSSLSPAWTDFTINEMYIPFLYQVVKYALSTNTIRQEYAVGETVRLEGRPGEEWDVRAPGELLFKVQIDDSGQGFFRETEVPGHYAAAGSGNQLIFSVNVDPRESLLAGKDPEEAYGAVVPPPDDVPLTVEEARLVELDDEERQQKFWRIVIFLMLLLFALETFIANRKTR